jgi:hypothetical protein
MKMTTTAKLMIAASLLAGAPLAAQPETAPAGPAVALAVPKAGEVLAGLVELRASASAAAAVQFELDGAPLAASMTAPPYVAAWDTTRTLDGDHVLTAVAVDQAGARAISPVVRVTVRNNRAAKRGTL